MKLMVTAFDIFFLDDILFFAFSFFDFIRFRLISKLNEIDINVNIKKMI